LLDPSTVRNAFSRVAEHYDRHAALEQEVGRRLLERCDYHREPPQRILDLGCGTGFGSQALKQKFRRAQVIGLDSARAMLGQMRRRSSLLKPLRPVCGDIAQLPFANDAFNLVFSNLAICWLQDMSLLFDELRRVLRPGGLLLFATLGPTALTELRSAWATVDATAAAPALPDLLQIGDALMAAGFREPVMDMERITLRYPRFDALAQELEWTGSSLLVSGWDGWRAVQQRLEEAFAPRLVEGQFPLTYEIVYGTAYGPPEGQPRRTRDGDVVTFSPDSLLKSRTMG
jgi:malonyl-CoA O-methyltransferase